ncbi:hypothetical protein BGZ70_008754 [Mortierella alpina]|uniref:Adhesin domain-containing protein n=1 Tax=Mortierella alpina TaxID=64518 RepID=A0A9P6J2Q0_MORAP|nr:hypothetical protein BGZ70_008754 [Mortierella alpina]
MYTSKAPSAPQGQQTHLPFVPPEHQQQPALQIHTPYHPYPSVPPQQPQQQPYPQTHNQRNPQVYPSSGPISYGATNNQRPNNNGFYPIPGEPVDDFTDAERAALARKLLCWYIKGLLVFSGGHCSEPGEYLSRSETRTLPAFSNLTYKVQVAEEIYGSVLAKESESWEISDIRVHIVLKATSYQLLQEIEQYLDFDQTHMEAKSMVRISDNIDKSTKKRLLRDNCVKTEIKVEYPRAISGTKRLHVEMVSGDAAVRMHPNRVNTIFEELELEVVNGEAHVENAVVSARTQLKVINGHIYGSLRTAGAVEVAIANGPIDLAIDTTRLSEGWNADENFSLKGNTLNGPITVSLAEPVYGNFVLKTSVGRPAINLSAGSAASIKYTSQRWNELQGEIIRGGSRGSYSRDLSSKISLETVNGGIRLNIQDKKK